MRLKILKPTKGLHDGSSFREILDIWREKNICDVIDNTEESERFSDETQWIESRPWVNSVGDILLYDQPILDKLHSGLTWNLALFANEVKKGDKCSSWTFWPNHPKEHEKVRKEGILSWDERENISCFIGSYTTGFRHNFSEWGKYIQNFWMGSGNQRLMTQNEYLNFLKTNKFGLCLRGVGPKCLRDVELIGMGTVPIFTPGVSTDYYNPLIKDVHYLYAETPEDIPELINNCSKEKWEYMHQECLRWFEENSSPEGVYKVTCKIIKDYEDSL
jgi:hypothetical protein